MTTTNLRRVVAALALVAAAAPGFAQTNIDAVNKFSFQENCGWMNWRDAGAPSGAQGAIVADTFLAGFIWSENVGWINLGNGAPADGVSYANPTSGVVPGVPEFGVNLDPGSGALAGFAWGENVGWINFQGGGGATPGEPAAFDSAARRLRGYAWGENIGWINLDLTTPGSFVGLSTVCSADFNRDGNLDPDDLSDFITCFFTEVQFPGACPEADFNADNNVDPDDLSDYITAFFGGCP